MDNIAKYQGDLDNLVRLGSEMLEDIEHQEASPQRTSRKGPTESGRQLESHYQEWYSECCELVRQLLPNRLDEFKELYLGSKQRGTLDATNYGIQHWLLNMGVLNGVLVPRSAGGTVRDTELTAAKLRQQVGILDSIKQRFQSSLFDIRQIVQADVFDSELEAATELAKNGFTRAAGSLAGVVLEKHLGQVTENHSISIRKRNPTISDFNDALKDNGTLDTPTWRQIQRLGDIRNLCSHNKEREPTREELDELISGVGKFTKTLF